MNDASPLSGNMNKQGFTYHLPCGISEQNYNKEIYDCKGEENYENW